MATGRISDTSIRALPAEGEHFLWDSELRGFGIRSGGTTKTFLLKYRVGGGEGRQRKFKIGRWPDFNAAQARERARQLLQAVARGEDPADDRTESREGIVVAEAIEQFLVEHVESKRKGSTARHYRDLVRLHIGPKLGRLKVGSVSSHHIEALHASLRATPITANRCYAVIAKFLSWSETKGYRERGANPAKGIEKYPERGRERFLSGSEIERLMIALANVSDSESPTAIAAVKLLLLTGARHREITTLKWSTVDLTRGVARLEDAKTGARNIYLSAPAVELLRALPRRPNNPYVCWGRRSGSHLINLQSAWERIRAAAELPGVRIHDLRHSAASLAILDGASLPMVGKLLGHKSALTTQRYSHLQDDPVAALAEKVGARVGGRS